MKITMDDIHGDGSSCRGCTACGSCIEHNDCENNGCGEEEQNLSTLSLHRKLEILEENNVYIIAGYRGSGEVLTFQFPDMTFVDFHWTETNDKGTRQYFKPTEFERMAEEALEYLKKDMSEAR